MPKFPILQKCINLQRSSKNLSIREILRKLLGAFLLLIFAFSITPRILLHNLVADHKDTPWQTNDSNHNQITKTGFNCNCENLVVESPFTSQAQFLKFEVPTQLSSYIAIQTENFLSASHVYFHLRGPPVDFSLI